MKKLLIALFLLLSIACVTVSACADEQVTLKDVNSTDTYIAKTVRRARICGEGLNDHYKVQQGSATDGTYGYFLLESKVTWKCALVKVNLEDFSIVDIKYDLPVDHGNDMTYNAKINKLVVVHNKPHYNWVSLIDPDTLEIVETKELTVNMFSIGYCEERDQYIVGLSGSQNFSILDSEFNEIKFCPVEHTTYVTQGADCDDKYVYFPQWDDTSDKNYIRVFDWDGNLVNTIQVKAMNEIESMFHVGDRVVLSFYAALGVVYDATILRVVE